MPAIAIGAPNNPGSLSATQPDDATTFGSMLRGTLNSPSSLSSQSPLWMLYNSVREALLASVTCARPPVRFQMIQLSTVPKHNSPASARARAPAT